MLAEEPKRIRVAVAGGGMGGLCVAIGLMKHPNIDVQIYEAAHKFAEIGAGVAIGPNAQRAMELISAQCKEAYKRQETHNGWPIYANTWFKFMLGSGEKEGELIAAPLNETGQSTVHRAHFLDEFVKLIPPERAHFGKRLEKIEDHGVGGVVLHFTDGTSTTADALIGADGVHSAVRKFILGADHPATDAVFTGFVAYRGLVPMDKAVEAIGAERAQNAHNWVGEGGVVMTYPIDYGKIMNVVCITANYKTWDDKPWVIPAGKEEIHAHFAGWGPTVHAIINCLDNPSAWSAWDHPPAPTYTKGHVVMMGDAAHATTPFQGQGAGQAMEDALVLETLFGAITDASQIPNAFYAFDQIRRARSQRIVTTSREAGYLMCGVPEPGSEKNGKRDWDKAAEDLNKRMHWIWNRDLVSQKEAAVKFMTESL